MIGHQVILTGMLFSLLLVSSMVLFYLRYRRHIAQQESRISRAETDHQRELQEAVIRSQEKERRRIGMNLHDDVGAALSVLRMTLEGDGTRSGKVIVQSKAIIDRVLADVRNISHDLFPIRNTAYTLTDAIADRCDAVNETGKVQVDLAFYPDADSIVPGETASLAIYRVVSELISNTVRHADARKITLRFTQDADKLLIVYHDDGKGMNAGSHSRGMGLQNIEHRLQMIGAGFRIENGTDAGFCFHIECPVRASIQTT